MRSHGQIGRRRVALVGIAAVLTACDSVTSVEGKVVDPAGRPVRGALIILRRGEGPPSEVSWVERTDAAGHFGATLHGGLRSAGAVLSACAPGFAPEERRVADGARVRDLTVTLRPGRGGGPVCEAPPGAVVLQ